MFKGLTLSYNKMIYKNNASITVRKINLLNKDNERPNSYMKKLF